MFPESAQVPQQEKAFLCFVNDEKIIPDLWKNTKTDIIARYFV